MATLIKLVQSLIGKEDVNWGDSSTTFSRETHTGGATDIHYIDAEVIPSTTLGGHIGDHLHTQNTDTGTTSTTFTINSGGFSPILASTGLTADWTFTFPNTSNQALIGATDLVSVAAAKGATLVGVQVSAYYAGANVQLVLTEYGADITTLTTQVFDRGMKNGLKLAHGISPAITVSGGMWSHTGTTSQHVYSTAQLTFTLGPAGSNATSSNLAANELHYIYISDAAVVTAGVALLAATSLKNSTTPPTWSESKVGWYATNDRCIGAILTGATSTILPFDVFGGHYYRYETPITEFATAAAGTTYASLDLVSSVPKFSTRARVRITSQVADSVYFFDTSSTGVTPEVHIVPTADGAITIDLPLSAAQVVYWYASAANITTTIDLCGYYLNEL